MSVKDEISRLAALSKLSFSDDEKVALCSDMERIMKFTDMISKASPSVEFFGEMSVITRADEPENSLPPKCILRNAPSAENGFFKLKRNGTVAGKNQKNQ